MKTQLLAWDTDILGIKVAKIIPSVCDLPTLHSLLEELKEKHVALVYWASDSADKTSQHAAQECKGFLSDKKVTYALDLHSLSATPSFEKEVQCYDQTLPTKDLEQLALQSGSYSRFKVDPKISEAQFEKLYKTWMTNSTKKVIADQVLVVKVKNQIVGMATLGEKNDRGDIGLLAVSKNFRGMKIGTNLVNAALHTFIQQGYSKAQVVSQLANVPACRLYETCHFQIEKVENFYHFWI